MTYINTGSVQAQTTSGARNLNDLGWGPREKLKGTYST